ncbi:MAG: alpha/beta fold hydrolase [Chloroflexi bacterium]|nr:alpha/beta fold hydrolase [Chloroflexota bacterium]
MRTARVGRQLRLAAGNLALVGTLGGASWLLARRIHQDAFVPNHQPLPRDLEVVDSDSNTIRLRALSGRRDWKRGGIWGLEGAAAYARVGPILELDRAEVVRELAPMSGGFEPGERVRMDNFAYPTDPQVALGIPYDAVLVDSPLGQFPAWRVQGEDATWVIFVHGKGSSRAECLRMLETIHALGLPALSVTYRNDPATPLCPTGRHGYGLTEWTDLEAAVGYARQAGATRLILVGYSMGGAVVGHFLAHSAQAELVCGLILDSPMISLVRTLEHAADQRAIGPLFSRSARRLFRARYGIDLGGFNCEEAIVNAAVPTLLFHGDADELVPIQTSDRLAQLGSEFVTYVATPGAHHVGSWNIDPAAYDRAVRNFVARCLG